MTTEVINAMAEGIVKEYRKYIESGDAKAKHTAWGVTQLLNMSGHKVEDILDDNGDKIGFTVEGLEYRF